jgi:hypothetical protein
MLLLTLSWEPDPPTIATPTSANVSTLPVLFLANLTRQYYGKLVKEVRRPFELLQGSWRQDGGL